MSINPIDKGLVPALRLPPLEFLPMLFELKRKK
jgi:hypothetical protein